MEGHLTGAAWVDITHASNGCPSRGDTTLAWRFSSVRTLSQSWCGRSGVLQHKTTCKALERKLRCWANLVLKNSWFHPQGPKKVLLQHKIWKFTAIFEYFLADFQVLAFLKSKYHIARPANTFESHCTWSECSFLFLIRPSCGLWYVQCSHLPTANFLAPYSSKQAQLQY